MFIKFMLINQGACYVPRDSDIPITGR